jgi:glycerophosphodiester phosphodiesterase
VKPFSHPNSSKSLKHTYWRSTAVIGHRGGGADKHTMDKTGKFHRTHITENTILSFVTAASLGAEYIEFDVHLTKDGVPVIYHDFSIPHPTTGILTPITHITLDEFKRLGENLVGKKKTKVPPDVFPSIARSKSLEQIPRHSLYDKGPREEAAHIHDTFPTFKQLFTSIPVTTGFNIEVKYPVPEKEQELGMQAVERNELVDAILQVVFDCGNDRNIFFSSFDPDVCVMLRLKQPKYPVFFLTHGGSEQFSDLRMNSLQQAVRFAKASHLMGIVSHATPIVMAPQLVRSVKRAGLVFCTYGDENNVTELIDLQERFGVDAIIVDHVAYVSNHMNPKKKRTDPVSAQRETKSS